MSDSNKKQSHSIIANVNESLYQKIDVLGRFVEKNAKTLTIGFVAFLGLCGIYFAFSLYSQSAALKKFDEAYAIEQRISKFAIAETDTSDQIKTKKSPETDGPEFTQIHNDTLKFIKDNASNEAARNLALRWSSYLYSVEQFEKSYEVLEALKLKQKSTLDALAVLAKASTAVQLGKFTDAIDIYKKIITNKKWAYVHPEARFQMSLAMIENNNEQEALENLKLIQVEYPKERKTIEEANKIIRWLTFKKQ